MTCHQKEGKVIKFHQKLWKTKPYPGDSCESTLKQPLTFSAFLRHHLNCYHMANFSPVLVAYDLGSDYWSFLRLKFPTGLYGLGQETGKGKSQWLFKWWKIAFSLSLPKSTLNLLLYLDQMLKLLVDGEQPKGFLQWLNIQELRGITLTGRESTAGLSLPPGLFPGMGLEVMKQEHFPSNDGHLCLSAIYCGLCNFPGGSDRKESTCNAGDLGLIPGSGRYLGEGNSNPLQYSCLENSMDRGPHQATVHGVLKEGSEWVWYSGHSLRTLGLHK